MNSPLSIARVREELAGAPASSFLGTSRGMSVGDLLPRHPDELSLSVRVRDQPNVSRAPALATEDLPEAAKRVEAALLRLCSRKKGKRRNETSRGSNQRSRASNFLPNDCATNEVVAGVFEPRYRWEVKTVEERSRETKRNTKFSLD